MADAARVSLNIVLAYGMANITRTSQNTVLACGMASTARITQNSNLADGMAVAWMSQKTVLTKYHKLFSDL